MGASSSLKLSLKIAPSRFELLSPALPENPEAGILAARPRGYDKKLIIN